MYIYIILITLPCLPPSPSLCQVAEEVSLPPVSPAVGRLLLPAVETELRRLIQLSHKFQRRGKGLRLGVGDINLALSTNRLEPIYGLHASAHLVDTLSSLSQQQLQKEGGAEADTGASSSSSSSSAVAAGAGACAGVVVEDATISLVELGRQALPRCPLASEVRLHWLAVDGQQPRTVDNPLVETSDPSMEAPAELSREMQYLYSRVVKMVMGNAGGGPTTAVDSALGAQRAVSSTGTDLVCECLRSDIGLQELVPYFCRFVYLQTKQNIRDVGLLMALMHMCAALMANPRVNLIPCLHQLLPAVFTCVVGAAGAAKPLPAGAGAARPAAADALLHHRWQLREFSARVIAMMCAKYGAEFADLYPRVCKTYYNAMFAQSSSVASESSSNISSSSSSSSQVPAAAAAANASTLYGGLVGTHALGHKAVKTLVIRHVDDVWRSACEVERSDVWSSVLLKSALVETLGSYLIHILKSIDMRRIHSNPAVSTKRKLDGSAAAPDRSKRQKAQDGGASAAAGAASASSTESSAGPRDGAGAGAGAGAEAGAALDEIAEQLVPYYCAGSSLVSSSPSLARCVTILYPFIYDSNPNFYCIFQHDYCRMFI
jgi:hypothetical protein